MRPNLALVAVILMVVLTGCSSAPTKERVNAIEGHRYNLSSVDLHLAQSQEVGGYPSESELEAMFEKKIENALHEAGLLAEEGAEAAVPIKITIDYRRKFAGEATPFPSESVVAPVYGYTIEVEEAGGDSRVIAEKKGLTLNRGFLGNLKTVATAGTGNDAEDEKNDMDAISRGIANHLASLISR
jgi:hypothetical protein